MGRTVRTTTAGVQAVNVQAAVNAMIWPVGTALFLSVCDEALEVVRKQVNTAVRELWKKKSKDQKNEAGDWFLLSKLIPEIRKSFRSQLNAALLEPPAGLKLQDALSLFATIGSWLLRESDTVRTTSIEFPEHAASTVSLARKKRTPRKKVQAALASYRALRSGAAPNAPEIKRNDVLNTLRERLGVEVEKAKLKGVSAAKVLSVVRPQLDSAWKGVAPVVAKLPPSSMLAIALTTLLRVHPAHLVWRYELDFGIENALRIAIREAARASLGSWANSAGATTHPTFMTTFRETLGTLYAGELATYLLVRRHYSEREAMTKLADDALAPHLDLARQELLRVICIRDRNAFERSCRTTEERVLTNALDDCAAPPESIEVARDLLAIPPSPVDGDKVFNVLIASLPPADASAIVSLPTLWRDICLQLEHQISQTRAVHTWSIAIPIKNWSYVGEQSSTASVAPARVLTSHELAEEWQQERLDADTKLYIVADDIRAADAQLAFREARTRFDLLANGLWFLDDRRFRIELGETGRARGPSGETSVVKSQPNEQFRHRSLDADDLQRLRHTFDEVSRRFGSSELWSNLAEGLGHLRAALSGDRFYERYSYLWMALETVLANLPADENPAYTSSAPIGERVAYRAALLSSPGSEMKGRPYSEARRARMLELAGLYFLRNKAVHEGRRNPPIDEVLLARFETITIGVFANIVINAFRFDLESVEDVLAWREHLHAATDIIK